METRRLGRTGHRSSLAVFGAAALWDADAETAERVLFFPAIALTFISSAFAPVGLLAGWMQPLARVNPVTADLAQPDSFAHVTGSALIKFGRIDALLNIAGAVPPC